MPFLERSGNTQADRQVALDSRRGRYVKLFCLTVKTLLRDLSSFVLDRGRDKNERADSGKSFFELLENVDLARQRERTRDSVQQHILGEWLEQNSDSVRSLNEGLSL